MSVTTEAVVPVDLAEAFDADIADSGVPSPVTAFSPSDDAPLAGDAAGRKEAADDATPTPTAEPSDETLTLTKAEYQSRIEAETKRQREAQASLAREKAALEKQVRAYQKQLESRDLGLNALQAAGQERLLTEADILRERQRMANYANGELSRVELAETEQVQALSQLDAQKQTIAASYWKDAMIELLPEARAVGIDRDALEASLDLLAHADETATDFLAEYTDARDAATADRALKRFYREVVKLGKADLQAKKIASLEAETPPPMKRPQATGRSTGGAIDPFAQHTSPLARGWARVESAFDEDLARAMAK